MISFADYFSGADQTYAPELTMDARTAAVTTIEKANRLIRAYQQATGDMSPRTVVSGWQPVTSLDTSSRHHAEGRAIDISDPEGDLKDWCQDHLKVLEQLGLWMEHPASSRGHCHVQTVEPKSGRRLYYP